MNYNKMIKKLKKLGKQIEHALDKNHECFNWYNYKLHNLSSECCNQSELIKLTGNDYVDSFNEYTSHEWDMYEGSMGEFFYGKVKQRGWSSDRCLQPTYFEYSIDGYGDISLDFGFGCGCGSLIEDFTYIVLEKGCFECIDFDDVIKSLNIFDSEPDEDLDEFLQEDGEMLIDELTTFLEEIIEVIRAYRFTQRYIGDIDNIENFYHFIYLDNFLENTKDGQEISKELANALVERYDGFKIIGKYCYSKKKKYVIREEW